MKLAILADVHFHDLYGDYDFEGVINSRTGRCATVRTLKDTVESTRIFNESYFAFLAALDDIVAQGIRHIILAGDYSDDGQRATVDGVVRILEHYSEKHGVSFYAATGNHDTTRPFGGHHTKRFLREDGSFAVVTSDPSKAGSDTSCDVVITDKMWGLGYAENLQQLGRAGFAPHPDHLHWETPFGRNPSLDERMFEIASADGSRKAMVPDASYLVEPFAGLWVLSLDTNVFLPKTNSEGFAGSTDSGWNVVATHKTQLLDWVRDVTQRAKNEGKKLLVFSHYPAVDYTNGTVAEQIALFGEQSFIKRNPTQTASIAALDSGLAVHFSGHLHIDAIGVHTDGERKVMNIAVPSIAAYPAAYKVVSFDGHAMAVETIHLDDVPRFDELFEHYRREPVSYGKILETTSYREFLLEHLTQLVLHRHLPAEWPEDLRALIETLSCLDLLVLTSMPDTEVGSAVAAILSASQTGDALAVATDLAAQARLTVEDFAAVSLKEMVIDWYRLRNAGSLARRDLRPVAERCYEVLFEAFAARGPFSPNSLQSKIATFTAIMRGYLRAPSSEALRIPL
ncbi:metallophosphoesterase [Microvirga alba]|uniref:Metallophosphoesterase n=1 Tax=Microvirga alba TaxID=2791025 RepID=A0A931BYP3_9HYPH|nr:metallophosphoesterase [Microvirga alba]MBF9235247.1 metallophosphoesterase [Microvirga alba]